ncbi:MAG: hypothetical protein SPI15_09800 [Candidatus Faecousia sp.]|nr:hypothetical protein [Clostridiales bacterium]MDY6181129.1 hypothetical protein [Candidatus Faecousia sp.]
MKHPVKRLVCMLAAIVLLAAMLPTAAMAYTVNFWTELYSTTKAEEKDLIPDIIPSYKPEHIEVDGAPKKISINDFKKYINESGVIYQILGFNTIDTYAPKPTMELPATIPAVPGDDAEYGDEYPIYIAYGPHVHHSEYWFFDKNNHWQYCDECGELFNMHWHRDHDENGICDACSNAIHYYTITLKDMTGGKITLSQEKGELNDRINVTVTPDAGYALKEIRFYNLNDVHSQLVRYEDVPGSEYHFVISVWDIEIEAEFEKVG